MDQDVPMGQPARLRERDAETARRAILAVAEESFARDGYTGARVDEIAATSGYNKSLIYHYFDHKLGLYRAVVGRCKTEIGAAISHLLEPFLDDEQAPLDAARMRGLIESMVRWNFTYYVERPRLVRIMGWEMAEGWTAFTQYQTPNEERPWFVAMRRLLRRAHEAGIIRRELDPDQLMANVMGMSLTYLLCIPRYQVFFPGVDLTSEAALDHAREQIVTLILHGAIADNVNDNVNDNVTQAPSRIAADSG